MGVVNAVDGAKYDVNVNGFGSKIGLALFENASQLALQVATHSYGGAAASMGMMFAQIFGEQYNELRNKGVRHEDAAKAASINAFVQSGLEEVGIRGWALGRVPSKLNKLKGAVNGFASEGLTEAAQELPEILTNLWAEHPDANAGDIGQMLWSNKGQYLEQMAISGIVGGIYGGGGGAINAALRDSAVADYQAARVENLGQVIQKDIDSGIDADYAATATDTISALAGNEDVAYIEAEPLNAFFQTVNEEEAGNMARLMGTTIENVREAAAEGTDVETTLGGVRGASIASHGALYEAIKNNLTFDLNSTSISTGEAFQKMMKRAYDLEAEQSQELYGVVDNLSEQLREAGATKEVADSWRTLLISRALIARPDNPAQFFKDHPLWIRKGDFADTNSFDMSAYDIIKSGGETVTDLWNKINWGTKDFEKINKVKITSPQTQIVYLESYLRHVRNKHDLTQTELQDIDNNLNTGVIGISISPQQGSFNGVSTLIWVKGDLHEYGVVLEHLPNGKTYFKTAFLNDKIENGNKNNVASWLKQKGARALTASGDFAVQSAVSSGHPLLVKSIQQHFVFVNTNNVFNQFALHGSPYNFDLFDLGKVGTGEGAQAHGWGLYFAKDRRTAETYKEMLEDDVRVKIGNKFVGSPAQLTEYYNESDYGIDTIDFGEIINSLYLLKPGKISVVNLQNAIVEFIVEMQGDSENYANEVIKRGDALINRIVHDAEIMENENRLYEVDIPENDVLLDEQKPLNEQPQLVKNSIRNLIVKEFANYKKNA